MHWNHWHGRLLAASAVACGLALAACTGGATSSAPPPQQADLAGVLGAFPTPAEVLAGMERGTSLTDGPLYKTGDAVSMSMPHNRVTAGGGLAHFTPAYTTGGALSAAAYCGYRFDLTGYTDQLTVAYEWDTAPATNSLAYIGAANFARNAWDWFAAPIIGMASLPNIVNYSAAGDNAMLVVVVCLGSAEIDLSSIRLGNVAPSASFTMSTSLGIPGDTVQFDGSASEDPDGEIARWRWDPEGDGTYLLVLPLGGPGSPLLSHTYSQPGVYHPTLKVYDNSGVTAELSKTLSITMGNYYSGTIDNSPEYESTCAAALVDGKPAVAYLSGGKLCYQYALSVDALNWSGAIQVDAVSGGYLDLAVIGGRPAIAYKSSSNGVNYVRASNAAGTNWPAPKALNEPAGRFNGDCVALLSDAGRPGIMYIARANIMDEAGELWYTCGTDADAADWQAPFKLNTSGIAGRTPALNFIYGVPMATLEIWPSGTDKQLRVARALDPLGNSWNGAITAVEAGTTWCSQEGLIDIGDKAGCGVWDEADATLKFVRAKQAEGLEFYDPVAITPAAATQSVFAFHVINGLPCCAYWDDQDGLCYVIAENSGGSAWNTPLVVDGAARAGKVSLIEVQGLPAFAWCDTDSGDLDFAIFR